MAAVFTTIRESSYTELGELLTSGAVSEAALRNYYKQEVKKARSRISKLKSAAITKEYGKQDIPRFMALKNLTNTGALLHEIADLNRFLNRKTSLESGLKKSKAARLKYLREWGLNISPENFGRWAEFVRWFNLSEYSKKFEYEADEVKEVFEDSLKNEKATPEEWERLFNEYIKKQDSASGVTQYL